jgi:hypothetical protein
MPGRCDLTAISIKDDMAALQKTIGYANGDSASHVIVARPGHPQRFPATPILWLAGRAVLSHDHDRFEHMGDERGSKPEIAVTALFFEREEPGIAQLGEVPARGLGRDAGHKGEFRRRESAAINQCGKHVRPRWISNKRRGLGYLRSFIHSPYHSGNSHQ